jgi:hypothetical protein
MTTWCLVVLHQNNQIDQIVGETTRGLSSESVQCPRPSARDVLQSRHDDLNLARGRGGCALRPFRGVRQDRQRLISKKREQGQKREITQERAVEALY